MSVSINDILPSVKDYSRNQNLDSTRALRAVNTAINFVKSQVGLPGHEAELEFNFFDDQTFYAAPSDFSEPINLRFDDDDLNQQQRFQFRVGELMFERIKATTHATRLWGTYYGTGSPQLMVLAKNSVSSILIDSFDSETTVTWTAGGDASNITYDPYTKKEGSASLAFDTNVNVANRASLTGAQAATDWSSTQMLGHFKLWVYLPQIANFTSMTFKFGSDNANYISRTVTTQEDGTAFVVGWNAIDFPWDSSVVQVGSPNLQQITYLELDFDYAAGFVVPVTNWRVDYLRIVVPDLLRMNYWTNYVGKTAGGAYLTKFTALTDVFLFGDIDPSLAELVAIQAAVIINPQILVDDKAVRQMYADFTTLYKRIYPRKKVNNTLGDPLMSRTTN